MCLGALSLQCLATLSLCIPMEPDGGASVMSGISCY